MSIGLFIFDWCLRDKPMQPFYTNPNLVTVFGILCEAVEKQLRILAD